MNAPVNHSARVQPVSCPSLRAHVDAACRRIAPTWPLDRLIAVNPWWGFVDRPIASAAAELAALSDTRPLMPRAYYRRAWRDGRIESRHVEAAIAADAAEVSADELIGQLEHDEAVPPGRLLLVSLAADTGRDLRVAPAWRDFVTHQLSQHCAAYFDQLQASWSPQHSNTAGAHLYASWVAQVAYEQGPRLLFGDRSFARRAGALSQDSMVMIERALRELGVPQDAWTDYCTALLLDVNGWAAWSAYLRWQARLASSDDDHLIDLLAMRIAWEWLLFTGEPAAAWVAPWRAQWNVWRTHVKAVERTQRGDWLVQDALERAYQETLCAGLAAARRAVAVPPPTVQAVFCIDVRSERFRRALEAVAPDVSTLGFAGFFGLPIAYTPAGASSARPQLPGLLAPTLHATDHGAAEAVDAAQTRRPAALAWRERWRQWRNGASSAFTFVESLGLLYAGKLFERAFIRAQGERDGAGGMPQSRLRPSLLGSAAVDLPRLCDVAAGSLQAMGLTGTFAPIVLLVGHGSRSANNPFAASLDCGACGGATGEVNARVLAELLNDVRIRSGLSQRGVEIPSQTQFVAALHNTTTDEVTLFDLDDVPRQRTVEVERVIALLRRAGERVRAERAVTLGLAPADGPDALLERLRRRANDWSEVRPEWGLADNAAFVVAPRERTRHLHLNGRVFLHDYDWRADQAGATLELIMTAPMVVAHWINMQYYASTVDNARYGSGNKVLHNVVGGCIGVFEGNGGDLRVGLPMQSLHDGTDWRHTPLRLSVFIEAPPTEIDAVLGKHEVVRQLVNHGWLHLFCIEPEGAGIFRHRRGHWLAEPACGTGD